MAINFLQNVSLNNTELQNFKVQNVTSDPSVTGEGQLIYRSDANVLKFYNGASWVTLDTNAGTVTSVGISSNYFTIGSTPITSSGIISVNMPNSGVTAQEYTHATITVNAQGVVTAASETLIDIPASQINNFTTSVETIISADNHAELIGNGALQTFTVNHALNTRDVIVQVVETATPWATIFAQVSRSTVNDVVITFSTVPTSNQYKVLVTKIA